MKTLLFNGKIWLGKNYFASSLGMDSETGKIIFVGKNHSDNKNIYNDAIDLKGKLVLPAFTDGHCHLFKGALVNSEIDLRYAKTKREFKNSFIKYKEIIKKNDWILGGYFSETNFTEKFNVDKILIDDICSDVPVVLFRTDLHSVICNSIALEKINITSASDKFNYDELIKNDKGELTGELKERAMYYAMKFFPEKSMSEKKQILKNEINQSNKFGITSVTDISWREDLDVYKSLLEDKDFNLKINSVIPLNEFEKLEDYKNEFSQFKDSIRFGSLKAFYDGSLSSHSALFFDNYKGKEYHGLRTEMVETGEFKKLGILVDEKGYQLVIHAIGDLAVSEVLDFSEELIEANGSRNRRLRIEHAQHIAEKDIARFKKLNIIASVQPAHLFFDAKVATENLVKPETTHIFKKLVDNDVKICFGTDFPVVPENPFETIYFAMTRKANGFPDGFKKDLSLDLITCLESYTINNAFASFEEKIKGSIAENKSADIIVLDTDIFNSTPDEIRNTNVEMTYLNGDVIYRLP